MNESRWTSSRGGVDYFNTDVSLADVKTKGKLSLSLEQNFR